MRIISFFKLKVWVAQEVSDLHFQGQMSQSQFNLWIQCLLNCFFFIIPWKSCHVYTRIYMTIQLSFCLDPEPSKWQSQIWRFQELPGRNSLSCYLSHWPSLIFCMFCPVFSCQNILFLLRPVSCVLSPSSSRLWVPAYVHLFLGTFAQSVVFCPRDQL